MKNPIHYLGLIAVLFTLSLFWLIPVSACGCGALITSGPDGRWAYGDDSSEQAFINFDGSTEKLIINLDIKQSSKNAVLVIPIPASPASVTSDILTELPKFNGYDVEEETRRTLKSIRDLLFASQIYPLVPVTLFKTIGTGVGGVPRAGVPKGPGSGVQVYQHIEKEGMIAEVLSASTPDALYTYLKNKGLNVDTNSIPVFRDYINKDFSFVVSWINPTMATVSAKGISAVFPATSIYYPLKPGSAYSGEGTTKTITVVGHVTPSIYEDIRGGTKVRYYTSNEAVNAPGFFSSESGFGYTKIVIKVLPQQLTQDLVMVLKAPVRIALAGYIKQYTLAYGLILLVIISLLSAFIAMRLVYSKAPVKPNFYALALANCFTIIGTIVGAILCPKGRRFLYVIVCSLTFTLLTWVSWYVVNSIY